MRLYFEKESIVFPFPFTPPSFTTCPPPPLFVPSILSDPLNPIRIDEKRD